MKVYKGYSLVELIVAIGIFGFISSSIILFSITTFSSIYDFQMKVVADSYRDNIFQQISSIKRSSWGGILENVKDTPMHITQNGNKYEISDGSFFLSPLTYYFTISNVNRDLNGSIALTGGTEDPHSKKISLYFSWVNKIGITQNYETEFYVNDWNTYKWEETIFVDFNTGSFDGTVARNNDGGEVELQQIFYPDWCKPSIAQTKYDIPGSATAKTLFTNPYTTYLGTGGDISGVAFTKLNVTDSDNPSIHVEGTFNGYLTNNIFVLGNYAYLGTTQDSKEVVILDISSEPYTEVGYFNTSRTQDANSVYVVNNIGYVAAGRYLYVFDLTSKSGSRPLLGSIQLSLNQNLGKTASVSQIVVLDNYLYASLDEDWYEFVIANISNPSSMSITSQTSVNNQQTQDLYLNSTGTRVYFGTTSSSYEREFFIINTESKNGARPIIGRYDTSGMSVKGLAIVEADNRAILVGTGAEEYQVLDISNESSPSRCGGMELNSGINDIDSVSYPSHNSYSYILTNDSSQDFQILRGGPGIGGGSDGYGYLDNGSYISKSFDTQSNSPYYFLLSWDEVLTSGSDLSFQVRSSTSTDFSGISFIGPDGSTNTYFTNQSGEKLPEILNGRRYFQYKVNFTSDTTTTPKLNSVTLNYGK